MRTRKITEGDIADKKVASLPTRPTAPTAFGGKGYTPTELKEAFDKLALHVIERFNELIDDITGAPEDNVRALPVRQEQPPEPDAGLVAAAELVVFDALSRAGGRLLTPTYRGQFKSTPRHELHTVINTGPDLDKLMEGSFQFAGNVADAFGREPDLFRRQLQAYVRSRLSLGTAHDRGRMTQYLDMAP
jgi:hypothetical protein